VRTDNVLLDKKLLVNNSSRHTCTVLLAYFAAYFIWMAKAYDSLVLFWALHELL